MRQRWGTMAAVAVVLLSGCSSSAPTPTNEPTRIDVVVTNDAVPQPTDVTGNRDVRFRIIANGPGVVDGVSETVLLRPGETRTWTALAGADATVNLGTFVSSPMFTSPEVGYEMELQIGPNCPAPSLLSLTATGQAEHAVVMGSFGGETKLRCDDRVLGSW